MICRRDVSIVGLAAAGRALTSIKAVLRQGAAPSEAKSIHRLVASAPLTAVHMSASAVHDGADPLN